VCEEEGSLSTNVTKPALALLFPVIFPGTMKWLDEVRIKGGKSQSVQRHDSGWNP
jgi:hypothetical protein